MENAAAYVARMRPIYLFKGFTDEQLLALAEDFAVETHPAGEVIFHQGDRGDAFYVITRGEVGAIRKIRDREVDLGVLKAGDFFGERALLKRSVRSATMVAKSDCELLRLDAERFEEDMRLVPGLRANLELMAEGRDQARRMRLPWLIPNEQVYAVARRHPIILYQALVLPAFLLIVSIAAGIGLGWYLGDVLWGTVLGGLGVLASVGWMWWLSLDWGNDFFIVTDQRVVYLEKIIGIYDSRQESPLSSVLSVDVRITDAITRSIGIGDVIVRTFSGPISFTSVGNAAGLAALVEEQWNRSRSRSRSAEREAMKAAIRKSINPPPDGLAKAKKDKDAQHGPGLLAQLSEFFSFKLRYTQGDTVIYRKHWFELVRETLYPTIGLIVIIVLALTSLFGLLPAPFTMDVVAYVCLLSLIPVAGWWLYQFEDWKNDLYLITNDQIVDLYRKPLGSEERRSAPLGNVLSLKYERPGALGLLLNYGSVVAKVGADELRFEGVFDPVGVQNDIYRRMEAVKARKEASEAARQREELSRWMAAYHEVAQEDAQKRLKP
ncbi:MAG: cyclic nucleotide-binding domain-containing protein [Anaerolineales bacterium]|nr:cyclic nucleotide-binding domain-containing protein [Anaerolineales bacterium]